ncbi:MAG: deoxyribose-phosphate aldolase [Patescibacteria group bacterium]
MQRAELASMIDHTNLKPNATEQDIAFLCEEAAEWNTHAVCVNSGWVRYAAKRLQRHLGRIDIAVCATIGFPLGASSTYAKQLEATEALRDGAKELDVVMNIGQFKSGNYQFIENEWWSLKQLAGDRVVKVILETCYLDHDEIVNACKIAKSTGVDFVKTSTGFASGGAKIYDVALMRRTVGLELGVKAAGGIKDYATAVTMIEAGANRIGCSNTVKILLEAGN